MVIGCGGLGDPEDFKDRLRIHSYLYSRSPDKYKETFNTYSTEELKKYHNAFSCFSEKEFNEDHLLRRARKDLEDLLQERESPLVTKKEP
jgi:hypothetical protein